MCGALAGDPIPVRSPEAVRPWQHVLNPLSGYLCLAQRSTHPRSTRAAGTDTPKPSQSLRLYLHAAPAKVEIFDPNMSAAPQSTDLSGATTISTAAPDTVRLIKITPRTVASGRSRCTKRVC